MADKRITELNLHNTLIFSDVIPIVNGGETKKTTYGALYYGIRDGLVSGSSQIVLGDVTNFTEYSSSVETKIYNLTSVTSSYATVPQLLGEVSAINTQITTLNNFTSSYYVDSSSFDSILTSLISATSSYLTSETDSQTLSIVGDQLSISNGNTVTLPTGSGGGSTDISALNTFTSSQELLNTTFATTGSNTFEGNQQVNGWIAATDYIATDNVLYTNFIEENLTNGGISFVAGGSGFAFNNNVEVTGSVIANDFTGSLFGTASNSDNVGVVIDNTTGTKYVPFVDVSSGYDNLKVDTGLVYSAFSNTLTVGGAVTAPAFNGLATNATNVNIGTASTNTNYYVTFGFGAGNNRVTIDGGGQFTYNPSTNTLTVPTVVGNLTGTATNATSASHASTTNWDGIINIPIGLVSSSVQITDGSGILSASVDFTTYSSSVDSRLVTLETAVDNTGSDSQTLSIVGDQLSISSGNTVTIPTGSDLPSGLVSGSSQVSYPDLSNIPSGIVSGSSQITITESQISDLTHTDISALNDFTASYYLESASFDIQYREFQVNTNESLSSLNSFTSSQELLNTTFATTESNDFVGDQVVDGFVSTTNGIYTNLISPLSGSDTINLTATNLSGDNLTVNSLIVTGSVGGDAFQRIATTGSNSFIGDQNVLGRLYLLSDNNTSSIALWGGDLEINAPDNTGISLYTYNTSTDTNYNWYFNSSGELTFPDSTIQTTAYPGPIDTSSFYYTSNQASDDSITLTSEQGDVTYTINNVVASQNSISSSHSLTSISASYSVTASHALNAIIDITDNLDGTLTFDYSGGGSLTTIDLTGPSGSQGLTGPSGSQGPQGPTGQDSSARFQFRYSTTTTQADPGAGYFRLNNSTMSSATQLYIDITDYDPNAYPLGNDLSTFLSRLTDYGSASNRGFIKIEKANDSTWYQQYIFSTVTNNSGYYTITLDNTISDANFTNDDICLISFILAGPQGPAGTPETGSLMVTASLSDGNLTFTKGDSSTFDINLEAVFTKHAWISTYSTSSQALVSSGSAQPVTFTSIWTESGVSLVSGSQITFAEAGTYEFNFVAQVKNTDNAVHQSYFWVKYNGNNFPNSTTSITLPTRKDSGDASSQLMTMSIIGVAQNNNDYIELYWTGDSTTLSLAETPAFNGVPETPSIIASIKRIG